jgi:putative ABC transport system permease protein
MWGETLSQDIRFGARSLKGTSRLTAAAVVTLALGIGAATAVFSAVKAVLLDALPYGQAQRVVTVGVDAAGISSAPEIPVEEWRTRSRSFVRMSAYQDSLGVLMTGGEAEMVRGLRVSYDFFDTLGVKMQLGRTFRRDEDQPGRRSEIILTHALWVRRFGADPGIVGRGLQLSESRLTVVGVLPPAFEPLIKAGSELPPEMYIPLGLGPGAACCRGLRVLARLKPGVAVEQARAEMNAATREIAREHGFTRWRDIAADIVPLRERLMGSAGAALWSALAAAMLLLLIACANVANLMLARGAGRTREMAARAALGAGRARLTRQLLTESLLVALTGGALGAAAAFAGVTMLAWRAPSEIVRIEHMRVDTGVLLFGFAVTLATGLGFGAAPAWRLSRVDLNAALKSGGSAGMPRGNMGAPLAVMEVSLAFVLVMGAGLMTATLLRLMRVESGYDPRNVLTLSTNLWGRYGPANARPQYYRLVLERLRATPGVEGAAFTSAIPMDRVNDRPFWIDGRAPANLDEAPLIGVASVSSDYFRVMRIPLRRGRLFDGREVPDGPPLAVISESCARTQFPRQDPIGKHIMLGEVIGVVGDVHQEGPASAAGMQAYISQAQNPFMIYRLVARTTGDPRGMEGAVREAFRAVDSTQPAYHVKPLADYLSGRLAVRTFAFEVLAWFAVLALLLAATGIYGIFSHAVSVRTREIGIRIALGAQRTDVMQAVLRPAMVQTVSGLALGCLASWMLTRLIGSLLFGVTATDAAVTAATAVLLAAVALAASYRPGAPCRRHRPLERVAPGIDPLRRPPVDAYIQFLACVFPTALEIHALLLFERLVHDGGTLARNVFDHHRPHEGMAALGELDETREFPCRHLGEGLPEIGLEIGQRTRRPSGDDFQLHRRLRAEAAELAHEADEIDISVAAGHPLSRGAVRGLENGRIAHVRRDHVRGERLQRYERVFHAPDRIAGVEAGSDELLAGGLDDSLDLARLHVARVIFERDLDVEVHGFGAHRPEELDRVLHVGFDGQRTEAVFARSHVAAHRLRPHRVGHLQALEDLLADGRAVLVEALARFADAAHTAVDRNAMLRGAVLHLLKILRVQAAVVAKR